MNNSNTRFTTPTPKSQNRQGWLSLLTFGVVVLIFALVAYQIGHEIVTNIRITTEEASPTSLPVVIQPAIVPQPTTTNSPASPPTVPTQPPAEVALPSSNKPGLATAASPTPAKSAAPPPTAKAAVPAPAQKKPVAPASSSAKPRPTTKPS